MKRSGTPIDIRDIDGKMICVGDLVTYDFDDNTSYFEVIYHEGKFRKKYQNWDIDSVPYPEITEGDRDLLRYVILPALDL